MTDSAKLDYPSLVCYCARPLTKMHRAIIDNSTRWICPKCKRIEIVKHGQIFACGRDHYYISLPTNLTNQEDDQS